MPHLLFFLRLQCFVRVTAIHTNYHIVVIAENTVHGLFNLRTNGKHATRAASLDFTREVDVDLARILINTQTVDTRTRRNVRLVIVRSFVCIVVRVVVFMTPSSAVVIRGVRAIRVVVVIRTPP